MKHIVHGIAASCPVSEPSGPMLSAHGAMDN